MTRKERAKLIPFTELLGQRIYNLKSFKEEFKDAGEGQHKLLHTCLPSRSPGATL